MIGLGSRPTRRLAAAIALAVTVTGAISGSPSADARSRCSAKGSATVAQSRYARVYRKHGRSYGCLFSAGRAWPLGDDDSEESIPTVTRLERVSLAGRYVGYGLRFLLRDSDDQVDIRVLDLRTGRLRSRPRPVLSSPESREGEEQPKVTDVQVEPHGAVAWIVFDPYLRPSGYEVRKTATRDRSVLLDSSDEIDPRSLSRCGHELRWINAGELRTAKLP